MLPKPILNNWQTLKIEFSIFMMDKVAQYRLRIHPPCIGYVFIMRLQFHLIGIKHKERYMLDLMKIILSALIKCGSFVKAEIRNIS